MTIIWDCISWQWLSLMSSQPNLIGWLSTFLINNYNYCWGERSWGRWHQREEERLEKWPSQDSIQPVCRAGHWQWKKWATTDTNKQHPTLNNRHPNNQEPTTITGCPTINSSTWQPIFEPTAKTTSTERYTRQTKQTSDNRQGSELKCGY